MEPQLHLLFVCTGNVCRSPIAERLAVAYGLEMGFSDLTASSAGTLALIGNPMLGDAALVLEGLGGDPSGFAARHLTPRIASEADLVLTMTREHRDRVLELAPRQLQRTFTLMEAARIVTELDPRHIGDLGSLRRHLPPGDLYDIADPISQTLEFFDHIGQQIADLLPPVLALCRRDSATSQ